jgi:IS30 family transposase
MSYTHLSRQERYFIYHMVLYGLSHREIGRRLGRHHTTIARELARNGPVYRAWVYLDGPAQERAETRRRQVRHRRKRSHARLYGYVIDRLQQQWSPEAIAGRLVLDFAGDERMRVSAEGIYRWIYEEASHGGQLYEHLRRRHKKRRRQRRYGSGRSRFAGRVSIAERPSVVDERTRYGDWEADSVEGKKGSGALATHVERRSRFLIAAKLVDKRAETFTEQSIRAFRRIRRAMRQTLTVDNGSEFARHQNFKNRCGLDVFFADPYSAWQRGTNENTNGLLRQYFPKGTDFGQVTPRALATVVSKLNNRPRKCLGYRTPREVFLEAQRGALGT